MCDERCLQRPTRQDAGNRALQTLGYPCAVKSQTIVEIGSQICMCVSRVEKTVVSHHHSHQSHLSPRTAGTAAAPNSTPTFANAIINNTHMSVKIAPCVVIAMLPALAGGMVTTLNKISVAGGTLTRFSHESSSTKTPMTAAIFVPAGLEYSDEIPALYWLSGLTCTDENFCQKSGAFLHAAYAEQYVNRTCDTFSLYSLFMVACSTPQQES